MSPDKPTDQAGAGVPAEAASPNPAKKQPWPIRLMRAQIVNADAESLGGLPLPLFLVLIVITSMLLAFPFINDRYTAATSSSNPDLYPGLQAVFEQMSKEQWDVKVTADGLRTGPQVPAQASFGKWIAIFEPAGGDPAKLGETVAADGQTSVVFFGKKHLGILSASNQKQFDGTWQNLEGFSVADFDRIPAKKLLTIVLYSAATGGMTGSFLMTNFLMLVQVTMMSLLMGFLLSLSRVRIQGTGLGQLRGIGFLSSWKTVIGVAIGPALLLAVALFAAPGAGSISWLLFSVIYAARIVLIYMGRFRNKKKTGSKKSPA